MNIKRFTEKLFPLAYLLLFTSLLSGQSLIDSRQTSAYTYIYKITNKEAKKIHKKNVWVVDSTFFHTLVDSFPTNQEYNENLDVGHYIKSFSLKNKQQFSIASIQDFDVFIFNNNTDLNIQIYDLNGEVITDADIQVSWKKLRYNKELKTYVDKRSNLKGIVKVTVNDFTAYYNLNRELNNSFVKRNSRKILWSPPVRNVWKPIRFVIHLPIDGVKSIKRNYSLGTIYRTRSFFVKSYNRVACLFDDYYCYEKNWEFESQHSGYLVFNKPKYLPGDTVKFKAYILDKKKKPIKDYVTVNLYNSGKITKLTELKPYNKGGYHFQFYLHDSLELKLDSSYKIYLENENGNTYISNYFTYADYELSKLNLNIRTETENHFKGQDYKLYIEAKDENELNVLDGRVEILINPKENYQFFDKKVFVPDTLLFFKQDLDKGKETEIDLSKLDFPPVNMRYNVRVKLLNSDNETLIENKEVNYYHKLDEFKIDLETDSIHFSYLENGINERSSATISSLDNYGNKKSIYEGEIPCKLALNPYIANYVVEKKDLFSDFDISSEASLIRCLSERTSDSIYIQIVNPRGLNFHYNVYYKNKEKEAGFVNVLDYQAKTKSKLNYFISMRYLWGGKIIEENYKIPFVDKKLHIDVKQPKLVYPGQETTIEVLVTDVDGAPVQGVDLTAYSLTKKFNYEAPELPYYGTEKGGKDIINNFTLEDKYSVKNGALSLNYESWKILAGIDSIEYYKFIYPENEMYKTEFVSEDSITQFSPFVVSEGNILPIHVIYIDGLPVYFSWSTNVRPYSFRTTNGYHQIKLRTNEYEITLDSMYFNRYKKQIFSLDLNSSYIKNVSKSKMTNELTIREQNLLYKYIMPYRNNFNNHYAYLQNYKGVHFLRSELNYSYRNLAGPVFGGQKFKMIDDFETDFFLEQNFEYEFHSGILKMRTYDNRNYPKYLNGSYGVDRLNDKVFTSEYIERLWLEEKEKIRISQVKYNYPNSTSKGAGELSFRIVTNDKDSQKPLNILLLKKDDLDFIRIYPGKTSVIHDLNEASYELIFFYSGGEYFKVDSLQVINDGLNFYEFDKPVKLNKDDFGNEVGDLIGEMILSNNVFRNESEDVQDIQNSYITQFTYDGKGNVISGLVKDSEGYPIIGASIQVDGTTFGTITDLDGKFKLTVPFEKDVLIISYFGYIEYKYQLTSEVFIQVTLLEFEDLTLDEVVVVGYGVKKEKHSLGSVVTANAISSLNGLNTGVSITNNRDKYYVDGISISQSSQNLEVAVKGYSSITFEEKPLYIINGNIFDGDISELDETDIENLEVLKGAEAISLYGEDAKNGVLIITTKFGTFETNKNTKGADYDETFLNAVNQSSSLRENFSDYAFWKPNLITDEQGRASFTVTFPDDITSWDTYYLAMNDNKQSGQTSALIKSYKPISAQLAVPRFLIEQDSSLSIGKVLNYSNDSVRVQTTFKLNDQLISEDNKVCNDIILDTLSIMAEGDSVNVTYFIEKEDGFFDGESHDIRVYPKGLEKSLGNFYVLDKDISFQLQTDPILGNVHLYAQADVLDIIDFELEYLMDYRYACNEQLASKLKALLMYKSIESIGSEEEDFDKKINKIIRLLQKNQNERGLWGWWNKSSGNLWISQHILEALLQASTQGYKVNVNYKFLAERLIWDLENSSSIYEKTRILKLLYLIDSGIFIGKYITELDNEKNKSLESILKVIELKQLFKIPYSIDTLETYKKSTILGNEYYSDKDQELNLVHNDIQNTILAYKILRADSTYSNSKLSKIRHYFLEKRSGGRWRNTYESAKIIETILPDILELEKQKGTTELILSGDLNEKITDFPYELKIDPTQNISISKKGTYPIYLTTYQKAWDYEPEMIKGDFEITTSFENDITELKAGDEVKLICNVKVKKDAEFVMINIPIPSGCSYARKDVNYSLESHREYFRNETSIFCENLNDGNYTFEIELISRFGGKYTLNPAKVELMYFPTFNANNELKKVIIK